MINITKKPSFKMVAVLTAFAFGWLILGPSTSYATFGNPFLNNPTSTANNEGPVISVTPNTSPPQSSTPAPSSNHVQSTVPDGPLSPPAFDTEATAPEEPNPPDNLIAAVDPGQQWPDWMQEIFNDMFPWSNGVEDLTPFEVQEFNEVVEQHQDISEFEEIMDGIMNQPEASPVELPQLPDLNDPNIGQTIKLPQEQWDQFVQQAMDQASANPNQAGPDPNFFKPSDAGVELNDQVGTIEGLDQPVDTPAQPGAEGDGPDPDSGGGEGGGLSDVLAWSLFLITLSMELAMLQATIEEEINNFETMNATLAQHYQEWRERGYDPESAYEHALADATREEEELRRDYETAYNGTPDEQGALTAWNEYRAHAWWDNRNAAEQTGGAFGVWGYERVRDAWDWFIWGDNADAVSQAEHNNERPKPQVIQDLPGGVPNF